MLQDMLRKPLPSICDRLWENHFTLEMEPEYVIQCTPALTFELECEVVRQMPALVVASKHEDRVREPVLQNQEVHEALGKQTNQ